MDIFNHILTKFILCNKIYIVMKWHKSHNFYTCNCCQDASTKCWGLHCYFDFQHVFFNETRWVFSNLQLPAVCISIPRIFPEWACWLTRSESWSQHIWKMLPSWVVYFIHPLCESLKAYYLFNHPWGSQLILYWSLL